VNKILQTEFEKMVRMHTLLQSERSKMNSETRIKRTVLLRIFLSFFLFVLQAVGAQTIVAPNDLANTYGGAPNVAPFDIGNLHISSMRYQQMYDASQFGTIVTGGEYITQIAFRAAVIDNDFSDTLQSIQFDLSTTANTDLSSTFADNVGIDDTTVFNGSWSFSSAGGAAGASVFDIVLNLTTPFFYNPANGNLVLDVRNFDGGYSAYFDDSYLAGEGISRVWSRDVSVSTAVGSDVEGLVTQFTFSPVPEPSSLVLITICSTAFAAWRKRPWERAAQS
jgi:hypothetical protein